MSSEKELAAFVGLAAEWERELALPNRADGETSTYADVARARLRMCANELRAVILKASKADGP